MKCFLTSSPMLSDTEELNPANGFIDKLKSSLPDRCNALFVSSDPDDYIHMDRFAGSVKAAFETAGFPFSGFTVLDRRNQGSAKNLVDHADFIILAGGHVPTQNKFFSQISLRDLLRSYDKIVMGISAGSMNSADVVYAQPELEGEVIDAGYQRFLTGLDLTKTMILPHYQMIKDNILDGMRIIEDITYPDSQGRKFYALTDGSYLYIDNGQEEICGEAYLIADGKTTQISALGETAAI